MTVTMVGNNEVVCFSCGFRRGELVKGTRRTRAIYSDSFQEGLLSGLSMDAGMTAAFVSLSLSLSLLGIGVCAITTTAKRSLVVVVLVLVVSCVCVRLCFGLVVQ